MLKPVLCTALAFFYTSRSKLWQNADVNSRIKLMSAVSYNKSSVSVVFGPTA